VVGGAHVHAEADGEHEPGDGGADPAALDGAGGIGRRGFGGGSEGGVGSEGLHGNASCVEGDAAHAAGRPAFALPKDRYGNPKSSLSRALVVRAYQPRASTPSRACRHMPYMALIFWRARSCLSAGKSSGM